MVTPSKTLCRRQIWVDPEPTTTALPHSCTPYLLHSGGILNLGNNQLLTLSNEAVFQPACPTVSVPQPIDPLKSGVDLSVFNTQDPFYMSVDPQIYAIAAVTIVSYMLVVILFITPRTYYVAGVGGGVSFSGRRGTLGGSSGNSTVIGIGSRPWLQKLAAITLAISLTIVTADTMKWSKIQYDEGYQDATQLAHQVINGLEVQVVRIISESFLWLAQAQTLIRLFQRRKEKLIIKWVAFIMITLEIIFSILNYFCHQGIRHQPRAFASSIPALNYLFALALNICYAAFVLIYALRQRRFAFFHPQMHSMPLMALLSIVAIFIPAIFFILDLSKPDVSGWGSYVRWVGACAASVVVWEWVERIEALEREEKKDGILGREVFDSDETFDSRRSKRSWTHRNKARRGGPEKMGLHRLLGPSWRPFEKDDTPGKGIDKARTTTSKGKVDMAIPVKTKPTGGSECSSRGPQNLHIEHQSSESPVSREDTTSPASTVYMVRYHPVTDTTSTAQSRLDGGQGDVNGQPSQRDAGDRSPRLLTPPQALKTMSRFSRLTLAFKRERQSPPAEVAAALSSQQKTNMSSSTPLTMLERLHWRRRQVLNAEPQDVIRVPARPRRRPSSSGNIPSADADSAFDKDSESIADCTDELDRPPAAVRNALKMSNPTSPVGQKPPQPATTTTTTVDNPSSSETLQASDQGHHAERSSSPPPSESAHG